MPVTPPPPAEARPATRRPFRRRVLWIAGGFAVAALAAFGVGLYRYQWHGGVTSIVTKVLPYPAAIVDGRVIRYSEYQDDLSALERFYDAERSSAAPGSVFPSEEQLRQRVLDQLIKDQLAAELAGRYGIVVTSDDVKTAYDATILDQASLGTAMGKAKAEARAADTLQSLYGLGPSQFKTGILQPFLVRQKLLSAIQSDETLNAENRKKAEAALEALSSGMSFKDAAAVYSEDQEGAANGGDRGWIGRGLLPPEVEAAAFALKPGETSGVVKSAFGYHVLRVTDVQQEGGTVSKVRLSEILVRPIQLDDYLAAQEKKASVTVFVHESH